MVWYSYLFKEFSTVHCDPYKGFSVVNEAEVDASSGIPLLFM